MGVSQTEIKTPAVIHRCCLANPYIRPDFFIIRTIGHHSGFMIVEWQVSDQTEIPGFAVQGSKIPAETLKSLLLRVFKQNLRYRQNGPDKSNRYILKTFFTGPVTKCYIKINWFAGKGTIVNDRVGLHQPCCLFRCNELSFILLHISTHPIPPLLLLLWQF